MYVRKKPLLVLLLSLWAVPPHAFRPSSAGPTVVVIWSWGCLGAWLRGATSLPPKCFKKPRPLFNGDKWNGEERRGEGCELQAQSRRFCHELYPARVMAFATNRRGREECVEKSHACQLSQVKAIAKGWRTRFCMWCVGRAAWVCLEAAISLWYVCFPPGNFGVVFEVFFSIWIWTENHSSWFKGNSDQLSKWFGGQRGVQNKSLHQHPASTKTGSSLMLLWRFLFKYLQISKSIVPNSTSTVPNVQLHWATYEISPYTFLPFSLLCERYSGLRVGVIAYALIFVTLKVLTFIPSISFISAFNRIDISFELEFNVLLNVSILK